MSLEDYVPQIMKAGIKNLKNLDHLHPRYFLPDIVIDDIRSLDTLFLKEKGIEGIIWDVDGVLMGYHDMIVDKRVFSSFLDLSRNFRSAILSNSSEERFLALAEIFPQIPLLRMYQNAEGDILYRICFEGEDFFWRKVDHNYRFIVRRPLAASLPFVRNGDNHGYKSIQKPDERLLFYAAEKLELPVNALAMVGDKIWTDIIGAKKAGAFAIYVSQRLDPKKDPFITRPLYFLQDLLLRGYGLLGYPVPQKLPRSH